MEPTVILFLAGVLVFVVLVVLVLRARAARARARERRAAEERVAFLLAKYEDASLVQRIMDRAIWIGQTTEQLTDSLGSPVDVDTTVLKTKTRQVWKYGHRGANRYALRVRVVDSCVEGWEEK
jgi:hypothetical protein